MSLKVDFVHWKTSIFVTIWPFSAYVNDQKMVQSLIPHYPEPFLSPWGPGTCHLYHLRQKSSNNYLQHFLSKSKFWNRDFGQTNKNGAPNFGYFHDFYQNFWKKPSGGGGEWGHWIFLSALKITFWPILMWKILRFQKFLFLWITYGLYHNGPQ